MLFLIGQDEKVANSLAKELNGTFKRELVDYNCFFRATKFHNNIYNLFLAKISGGIDARDDFVKRNLNKVDKKIKVYLDTKFT